MQLANMNLIDLFRNWFFSLICKQNLLIVSFQGFVEMVLMKWKTILGPSCSFSSLVEITQVIWHFWQWLEKLLGDDWTKWSLKFSNTDLLKTQLLIQINSPLPLKKRKFFFSLMQFSISPKGLIHQKFVIHWSSFCLLKWNQSEIAS